MKIKKTLHHSNNQNLTTDDFAFKYLHKQFPWLSEGEIMKAFEIKGPNPDQVWKYLEERSGKTLEN